MADNETSAIDVLYEVIVLDDPATGPSTFIGSAPDNDGLLRELSEGVDQGSYKETMAPGIQIEMPAVEIAIRGMAQDYLTPRNEALRLRRLISRVENYTLNDVRIMRFQPLGGVNHLGQDAKRRHMFSLRFEAYMEVLSNG